MALDKPEILEISLVHEMVDSVATVADVGSPASPRIQAMDLAHLVPWFRRIRQASG